MKKSYLLLAVCLVVTLMSGCSKPDSITTIKSPTEGLFYTVEIFKAGGPTSDTTRVYAHLERNGKAKKMIVLDGENVTVSKIRWNNPHDTTLCLDGGITDTFRNEVTLIVGDTPDDSETIHNHLREHCDSTSTISPNATN
jgi:uncharacterized protein YceK